MLLQKMKDVNWINRPSEDGDGDVQIGPQTDIVQSKVQKPGMAAGGMPGAQPPAPGPINPQAINSLTDQAMAQEPEPMQKPPTQNPYGAKMQHLATMGKIQNMKYPELKKKKTLAGDDNGLGIY